jgi:hypothetical protein
LANIWVVSVRVKAAAALVLGVAGLGVAGAAWAAGGFADAVSYPTADQPQYIAVGDYDADGRKDLAVSSCSGAKVSILHGRRHGKFAPLDDQPVPGCGGPIVAGHFDSNKKLDLVVADQNAGILHFLKGKGDGDFADAVASDPDLAAIQGLVARDFDRDGDLDLAVTDYSASVGIILGNGEGTFGDATLHDTENNPVGLVVTDLNHDHRVDLATANQQGNSISVLYGQSGGTYAKQVSYPVAGQPYGLAKGDFNEDGRPDLVASRRLSGGGAAVLLQKANGTFKDADPIATGTNSLDVVTSDINRDGHSDVVFSNDGDDPNIVSVVRGRGDGTFRSQLDYPVGAFTSGVVAQDFNGDHSPDLVTADAGPNVASVLLSRR